jgi:hypothetical protein
MKHFIALPFAALLFTTPLSAQQEEDGPSMMERGAQQFFDGLMQEMAPALDELGALMDDAGPALQDFMAQMGPKLRTVLDEVEDWSVYEAPEVQPNGDIIIRRKPDAPEMSDPDTLGDVEQTDL